MKKIIIPLSLIGLALIISGCSINLSSSSKTPADGGIFKSTDFGENWQQKAPAIAGADMLFVTFDPTDAKIAYLSMKGLGIFKTIDGGDSWQNTPYAGGTYASLAIDHQNSNVIYVIKDNKIIKSVDGLTSSFETYTETRPEQTLLTVVTDPNNYNVVYAAATTSLIKSTDYGNTWKLLNWQDITVKGLYQSSLNNLNLYALTAKGIYKSANGGIDWADSNQGLAAFSGASTIYWLDFDPNTENMLIGTTDSILKSTDGAATWREIPTLFEFKKVPIQSVIHKPENLNEIIFPYTNILLKTDDGGKTWKSVHSIPTSRTITYLTIDPNNSDTIYAGTTAPPQKK